MSADGKVDQLLDSLFGGERAPRLDGIADHPVQTFNGVRNRYDGGGTFEPAV